MITKVLVTGGRDYKNQAHVNEVMDQIVAHYGEILVIHGTAGGADSLVAYWAICAKQHQVRVPALWDRHRKAAGPIRNAMMLRLLPDICVAFPGGSGTANMMYQARTAGIPTYLMVPDA